MTRTAADKICLNTSGTKAKAEDKRQPVPRPTNFKGDEPGYIVLVFKRDQ